MADALVALHALFVVFAIGGGILVVWRPIIALAHLPAALWAAWVELSGSICPLTPIENAWRGAGGKRVMPAASSSTMCFRRSIPRASPRECSLDWASG